MNSKHNQNKTQKHTNCFMSPGEVSGNASKLLFFVWDVSRPTRGLGTKVPGARCAIHLQKHVLGAKPISKSAWRKRPHKQNLKEKRTNRHTHGFLQVDTCYCYVYFNGLFMFSWGRALRRHRGPAILVLGFGGKDAALGAPEHLPLENTSAHPENVIPCAPGPPPSPSKSNEARGETRPKIQDGGGADTLRRWEKH